MKKFIIFSLMIATAFSFAVLSPILAEGNNQDATTVEPIFTSFDQEEIQSSSTPELEEKKVEENKTEEKRVEAKTQVLMSNLEKILTPDQIKYFTNIVRQGSSLYGVKKIGSTTDEIKTTATTTTDFDKNIVRKIEKIAAPWLIHQYEQIRRVGTALWGLKKDDSGDKRESEDKIEIKNKYITLSESACVIAAVKVKDTALQTNNENAKLAFNNAIISRTTCQEAAINKTAMATSSADLIKQQKNELSLCLQAFKEVAATAKKSTANQHKTIWETYRNSLKSCNVSDSSELIMVEDGGGNIFESAL